MHVLPIVVSRQYAFLEQKSPPRCRCRGEGGWRGAKGSTGMSIALCHFLMNSYKPAIYSFLRLLDSQAKKCII